MKPRVVFVDLERMIDNAASLRYACFIILERYRPIRDSIVDKIEICITSAVLREGDNPVALLGRLEDSKAPPLTLST